MRCICGGATAIVRGRPACDGSFRRTRRCNVCSATFITVEHMASRAKPQTKAAVEPIQVTFIEPVKTARQRVEDLRELRQLERV